MIRNELFAFVVINIIIVQLISGEFLVSGRIHNDSPTLLHSMSLATGSGADVIVIDDSDDEAASAHKRYKRTTLLTNITADTFNKTESTNCSSSCSYINSSTVSTSPTYLTRDAENRQSSPLPKQSLILPKDTHFMRMNQPRSEFTDATFPPNSSSLGRLKINPQINLDRCKCGMKSVVRTVSKAGPNQGRIFLSCPTKSCGFFQWTADKDIIYDSSFVRWKRFRASEGWHLISSRGAKAEDVQQGKVGDCWLLSAMAVIAARSDLVAMLLIDTNIPDDGRLRFRLFIDGKWTDIEIDSMLPCVNKNNTESLAFSQASASYLWAPFLEKAYAKVHGSYGCISGGQICEAMHDITGAPCETIDMFSNDFDSELTWGKLISYSSLRFPIGVATATTGEGIVGSHAYSLLEVRLLDSSVKLGQQQSIRDFFPSRSKALADSQHAGGRKMRAEGAIIEGEPVRLLKIRNPWGRCEWDGLFGAGSDVWTSKLRSDLSQEEKNNGVFWITWHDFLRRFERIDVCKAYLSGWTGVSLDSSAVPFALDSKHQFSIRVISTCTVYLWTIQRNKRGRSSSSHWYIDTSLVVLDSVSGAVVAAQFNSPQRDSPPLEVMLAAGTYSVLLLHFDASCTAPIVLRFYSTLSANIQIHNSCLRSDAFTVVKNCMALSTSAARLRHVLIWSGSIADGEALAYTVADALSEIIFVRVANMCGVTVEGSMSLVHQGYKSVHPIGSRVHSEPNLTTLKWVLPPFQQCVLSVCLQCSYGWTQDIGVAITAASCKQSRCEDSSETLSKVSLFQPWSCFD